MAERTPTPDSPSPEAPIVEERASFRHENYYTDRPKNYYTLAADGTSARWRRLSGKQAIPPHVQELREQRRAEAMQVYVVDQTKLIEAKDGEILDSIRDVEFTATIYHGCTFAAVMAVMAILMVSTVSVMAANH